MMSKTGIWLKTAKATPIQIVLAFGALMYFIISETDLYAQLPDMWQIAIYATIVIASILTGMSLTQSKELANQIKTIGKDKTKSNEQKVEEMLEVADEAIYNAKKLIKKE